jgi:hypothetical protein
LLRGHRLKWVEETWAVCGQASHQLAITIQLLNFEVATGENSGGDSLLLLKLAYPPNRAFDALESVLHGVAPPAFFAAAGSILEIALSSIV